MKFISQANWGSPKTAWAYCKFGRMEVKVGLARHIMAFLFWLACTCQAGNGNWNTFVFKTLKFSHLMQDNAIAHLFGTLLLCARHIRAASSKNKPSCMDKLYHRVHFY